MNILAIDTAGKTAAVAVMRDDTLLYEMASNTGLTHREMEQVRYLQIYICIMYWITGLM